MRVAPLMTGLSAWIIALPEPAAGVVASDFF